MKYFRVKYGYGVDDFYSVDETEVAKCLRAMVNGTVVLCDGKPLAGNSIITIQPDYQRAMGWKRDYVLTGEDYAEIGDARQREYAEVLKGSASPPALKGGSTHALPDQGRPALPGN